LIFTTHPRSGKERRYTGKAEGSYLDFPMACLVNNTTASGSEIVAACLQDHKRARIVGERTYGKGSVQDKKDFEGGEITLTTQVFKRPSGKNIERAATAGGEQDEWGVTPDLRLNLTSNEKGELQEYLEHVEVIPRPDRRREHARRQFRDRQLGMAVGWVEEAIRAKR
jgi:carboxyl-terminal processing protease